MTPVAEQLDTVIQKTTQLIELCTALQEENELLTLENQKLRSTLDGAKQKNLELEEKLRVLKLDLK